MELFHYFSRYQREKMRKKQLLLLKKVFFLVAGLCYQNSPEAFNKYFLSITENIIHDIRCNNKQGYNINKNPNNYLLNLFHKPFPSIKFKNTWTKEIEKIINFLKKGIIWLW
jgi:hypothetical protein